MGNFNDDLGMRFDAERGVVTLEAGAAHEAMPGTVHFAVLTTLAEVAAAHAVAAPVVPASVQVSLLRRAAPGALEARGRLLKRGRRLAFAEGEVTREGRPVARATVTFAVIEEGG